MTPLEAARYAAAAEIRRSDFAQDRVEALRKALFSSSPDMDPETIYQRITDLRSKLYQEAFADGWLAGSSQPRRRYVEDLKTWLYKT